MTIQRQVGAFMDSKPSGEDLTGKEYHFAIINNAGALVIPGLGAAAVGVIQEGKAVGRSSSYATAGQLKVLASAAIDEGDEVTTAADGTVRVAAAGHEILGKAQSAAGVGELATINFNPKGLHV